MIYGVLRTVADVCRFRKGSAVSFEHGSEHRVDDYSESHDPSSSLTSSSSASSYIISAGRGGGYCR